VEVVVAGATGALGSRIVRSLLGDGVEVRALVRNPAGAVARALAAAGARLARCDLTDRGSLAAALDGAAVVVSTATCFPRTDEIDGVDREGNLALVDAAEAAGAGRFVFVSLKPVALDFPLQRAKRAVEERLAAASLDAVVLRPGKLMDVWFSPICGFDPAGRSATIFGAGTAPVSWLAAADLARIAALAAVGMGPHSGIVELGGPEALSQRDVVAVFERVTGSSWRIESVPVDRLEQMQRFGEGAVVRSLGALMLEAHLGAVTDPDAVRQSYPVPQTTVSDYAATVCSP
jgi:uncharacterized protein YbjT (DUF2867 family)